MKVPVAFPATPSHGEKIALGVAQALIIGGIFWLMSGVAVLKTEVAVLKTQACICGKSNHEKVAHLSR